MDGWMDRSLTINPADELLQGLDFPLDSWLGKRIVVLRRKKKRKSQYGQRLSLQQCK